MNGLAITWAREVFILLPQRAIYWPAEKALIVADVHIGKDAAYRAWGVPVPAGPTGSTLDRLATLLHATCAKRLLILGDLLHARAGCSSDQLETIQRWRAQHSTTDVILVRGNHDLTAGDPPPEWRIECCDGPLAIRGIHFIHDPADAPRRGHWMAGHIHPVWAVSDDDGTSLRSPCFWVGSRGAVLPAFGGFTGGMPISRERGDRIILVAGDDVAELPSPLAPRRVGRRISTGYRN